MRFQDKSKLLIVGQRRIIRKFLWFPLKFDGQTRWLEYADIVQEVYDVDVGGSMEWGKYKKKWVNRGWANYTKIYGRWWV